jgi:hypothetical protein
VSKPTGRCAAIPILIAGDFHLAAWLARIVHVVGGKDDKDGVNALEKTLGHAPSDRVKAYWQAWVERPSWKVVYGPAAH